LKYDEDLVGHYLTCKLFIGHPCSVRTISRVTTKEFFFTKMVPTVPEFSMLAMFSAGSE
jgi:hypothetical protein